MGKHSYANNKTSNSTHHSLNLILFRRIARIALWISAISVLSLGLLILSMDNPTGDYLSMLQSLTNSQDNLPYFILAVAAWLIGATAATTYFIILYSSFRIAGPIFRFARNLEFGHQHELPTPHIKLRSYDYFQDECQLMDESISTLIAHYQLLATEIETLAKLPIKTSEDKEKIIAKIQQIKNIEARVTQ